MLYDVFISHASEDKEDFVRSLAAALREKNIEVWYDEFSLDVGDSLARAINLGLTQSRFGIVVLSPSFFAKGWTDWELNGLVARQNSGTERIILPIWHNVGRQDVLCYSAPLADINAVSSELALSEIVGRLSKVIHPKGSTLVVARDLLIEWGQSAPVVTDDWWLDVAAFAEANDAEGGFQEAMGWGRWGFPLPPKSDNPAERGSRLAWAAMQMRWQDDADDLGITQLTNSKAVLEFVAANSALQVTAHHSILNLRYLLAYAPQLAIRGMGGEFEDEIEAYYLSTLRPSSVDPSRMVCGDDVALRGILDGHSVSLSTVACNYIQGDLMGPPVRTHEMFDYVVWLLSSASGWMPEVLREGLLRGIAEWSVWPWGTLRSPRSEGKFESSDKPFTGEFAEAIHRARHLDTFRLTSPARDDLRDRVELSVRVLSLPESADELVSRFIGSRFLADHFGKDSLRRH
jgi:hypothetical protein